MRKRIRKRGWRTLQSTILLMRNPWTMETALLAVALLLVWVLCTQSSGSSAQPWPNMQVP
jgi:hypothetical protein